VEIFEKRILGVDYGLRRIGMAVSDPFRLTAQPLSTLVYATEEELWQKIGAVFNQYSVETVVIGLPLNLNGSESDISLLVKKFKKALEQRFQVPCRLWDERFTTQSAKATLREMGLKSGRKKERRDQIAAVFILQGYLDHLHQKGGIQSNEP